MNQFSNTQNSGLLKADYSPTPTGDSDLYRMLRRKRQRLADTKLGIKDQFPREVEDEQKGLLGGSTK